MTASDDRDDEARGRDEEREDYQESGESEKERIDRELVELLNELRVALPGVQVLFAFLLTVPFSQGFTKLTGGEKELYSAAILSAAAATALLIAPSSHHRLSFRAGKRAKEEMVITSNRLAIGGLLFLMISMAASVYLVMSVVFSAGLGLGLGAATIVWFAAFWYLLPLIRRLQRS